MYGKSSFIVDYRDVPRPFTAFKSRFNAISGFLLLKRNKE
jgi:hypothetical protein